MNWFNKVTSKVISVVDIVDDKYESMCIRAEKKITGGSTLDKKLEQVVAPVAIKSVAVRTCNTVASTTSSIIDKTTPIVVHTTKIVADSATGVAHTVKERTICIINKVNNMVHSTNEQ